jgi:site-specific recombinase XerD
MPRTKTYLPRPAKTFLATREGRWCLPDVRRFHRWMGEKSLVLADLTGAHVDSFFAHEQQKGLAPSTRHARRCRVHKYLYWLSVNGHLRFVVEPPRLRHMRAPLPKVAKRFLARRGHRQHSPTVRNFHDWLHRNRIDLGDLTPAHIEAFLRRPISKDLAMPARKGLLKKIAPYLLWLNERGHVRFRLSITAKKTFPLPASARDFIDSLRPVLKPATCAGYVHDLRDFHAWLAAIGLDLTRFDRPAAERWLKSLADRGLAACTRNGRIFHVRSYLCRLDEQNAIHADPNDLLRVTDLPKIPSYLPRPFPPEADRELQKRFLAVGTVYGQALFLMRRSGVRIGELVRLETDCLETDLNDNVFLKVPLGKLDNERLVPLDPQARDVLKSLQEQGHQDAEFLISPHLSRDKLKALLSETLKQAASGLDIPGAIVSHRLRHTYATELLNAGLSLVTIMKLLGHRSFRMTMRYAAIAQKTIVDDYNAALQNIARKYDTQVPAPHATAELDLQRQAIDLISSLRKTADTRPDAKPRIDALIKRLYKISDDITALIQTPQPI